MKKFFIFSVLVFGFFVFVLTASCASKRKAESISENPLIVADNRPLIASHRAGAEVAPENTLRAIKYLVNEETKHSSDIIELDLKITKDGYLILLHDKTFDRTSNSRELLGMRNARPSEFTLEQIRDLNLGENFRDLNGNFPYRNLRGEQIYDCLRPVTINEVFAFLENETEIRPLYILEIKDSRELGRKAVRELVSAMNVYRENGIFDRIVVGSFNGEVLRYIDENFPEIKRSASIGEVMNFYFRFLFRFRLNEVNYTVLQIPYRKFLINFANRNLVNFANRNGIAVQYWTVNDERTMRRLIGIGADAIITDRPDLLYRILSEKK